MAVLMFLTLLVVAVEIRGDSVCYGKLGCFDTGYPFTDTARPIAYLPQSPDEIVTVFNLYTRDNQATSQDVDARTPEEVATKWTNYKVRPTVITAHGFMDSKELTPYQYNIRDEVLKYGDYNVIIVDWSKGNLPSYTQACANARLVGAQIALLVENLIQLKGANASDFHLIGHSLGVQVAGYAGERIPGLRRITGLDPAGPYFENTDPAVRLDPTDAEFVDAIHTDSETILTLGLGTKQPEAHSDFYPNLGHDQPECTRDPFFNLATYGLILGIEEEIACSHVRSLKYFIESINSPCPFLAFPCASEEDFAANRCHSCTSSGCAQMGWHADKHIPPAGTRVKYYSTTAGHEPFCQYHLDITVKFASSSSMIEERGEMSIKVVGDKGTTDSIPLVDSDHSAIFRPGTTQTFYVMVPSDVGNVKSVQLSWSHVSTLTDPLHWNLLGLRTPTLYLEEVDVLREEAEADVHLCASDQKVISDHTLVIGNTC